MIKALRRKFTAIMMSMVALILLGIFMTMLYTTKNNLEKNSVEMLEQAVSDRKMPAEPKKGFDNPPRGMRLAVMVIELDGGGYSVITNQSTLASDDDLPEIVEILAQRKEDTGIISEYSLRYLKREIGGKTRVALSDTSMESGIIKNLVINSLLIGAGALLLFFILSVLLARWAVRPVEAAWLRQKQFVADASHELKTPLTVILSNAEMLDETTQPDKLKQRVENIHAEGIRMKRLIEDLLSLARSDYSPKQQSKEKCCLSDIITESVLLYESTIFDEGKALNYVIAESVYVMGFPARLRQLADILIDNAKKYTDRGGIITISLSVGAKKNALLTVENTGNPIPQDELENIFRRFYRVDKSRENHGGFGLGLSIAESIAAEHKARLWAESDGGKNVFKLLIATV